VELAYVTLTSGLYAGLQQKALGIRSRWLGNSTIILGVPWLAQAFDWLAHRAAEGDNCRAVLCNAFGAVSLACNAARGVPDWTRRAVDS
jgi:hypothetical protein